jgi:HEAT repeat protein
MQNDAAKFDHEQIYVPLALVQRTKPDKRDRTEFSPEAALVTFEDGCEVFYLYRAFLLAAAGIAEFQDCSCADQIVKQVIKLGFGYFNEEKREWVRFNDLIEQGARTNLLEIDRTRAIAALIQLLEIAEDESVLLAAVESLEQIGTGNTDAITALTKLLEDNQRDSIWWKAAESLWKIDPGNPNAINTLTQLMQTSPDCLIRCLAASILWQINPGNSEVVRAVFNAFDTVPSEIFILPKGTMRELAGNSQAISTLIELLHSRQDECNHHRIAESLGEIGAGNQDAIDALTDLLTNSKDKDVSIRRQAAISLGKINPASPEPIKALDRMGEMDFGLALCRLEIEPRNPQAIAIIINELQNSKSEDDRRFISYFLCQVGVGNLNVINALVDLLDTNPDEDTRWYAIIVLKEIGAGNSRATATLTPLLDDEPDEQIRWKVADALGAINPGNSKANKALTLGLKDTEDEYKRLFYAESLLEIDPKNWNAITTLLNLMRTSQNVEGEDLGDCYRPSVVKYAADNLPKIKGEGLAVAVSALKDCLTPQVKENDSLRYYYCYKVIWHCAQTLPYPEFYKAWHHPSLTPHPEVVETTGVSFTPDSQRLNLAEFPSLLRAAINSDSELRDNVQLICIDGSKFCDRDNPATKIYNEMRRQGCPKSEDSKPKTMAQLQDYWDELSLDSDKHLVLVFYERTPLAPLANGGTGEEVRFSNTFLSDLSKFDGAICVVTEQLDIPLKSFSPSQPNLVEDIVEWLRRTALER